MHAGDEDTKKKPRETQSLRRKEDLLEEQKIGRASCRERV